MSAPQRGSNCTSQEKQTALCIKGSSYASLSCACHSSLAYATDKNSQYPPSPNTLQSICNLAFSLPQRLQSKTSYGFYVWYFLILSEFFLLFKKKKKKANSALILLRFHFSISFAIEVLPERKVKWAASPILKSKCKTRWMEILHTEVSSLYEQGSQWDFFQRCTVSLENPYLKNLTMIITSYNHHRVSSIYLLK